MKLKYLYALLLMVSSILSTVQVKAQHITPDIGSGAPGFPGPVTGPSSATAGTSSTYTVTAATNATSYAWTITPTTAGSTPSATTTATIAWNLSYTGTVSVECYAVNGSGRTPSTAKSVTITAAAVTPGTISASQTINYNTVPVALTGTAATGGNNTYAYQWQSSANGTSGWTNITTNGTSQNYAPLALTATTYYQRIVTSNGSSATSNIVAITVYPQLIPGSISPTAQTVLTGSAISLLTLSGTTGGNSSAGYSYQWQSSPDNGANNDWSNIPGATNTTYNPGNANTAIFYQVAVSNNGNTVYTASSSVVVSNCQQLNTSPTGSMNYIITSTFRQPGTTTIADAQIGTMGVCDVNQSIQYLDGLGRPLQNVEVKASSDERDIIQPFAYDQYGRESTKYLPYVVSNSTTDGVYQSTAITDQATYYNPAGSTGTQQSNGIVRTDAPFSVTGYELSPLNRVVEQGAPGDAWQFTGTGNPGSTYNTVRTVYATNDQTSTFNPVYTAGTANPGSRVVALYSTLINSNETQRLVRSSAVSYMPGTLSVTITRDENWQPANGCIGTTEEYKDMLGHVVLKRAYNLSSGTLQTGGTIQMLSTYYIYDDLGNLAFVLPPGAAPDNTGTPVQAVLDNICYQYQYDGRGRMVAKKIPGKGWEYMIYDNLDQLIATQDSVQRGLPTQQVSYIKYDGQGREIMTGYYTISGAPNSNNRAALQTSATAETALWETKSSTGVYSNLTIPTSGNTTLVTNYYDDYNNSGLPSTYVVSSGVSVMTRSLPTASSTAVLNTPADVLWNVKYYDDLGRDTLSYAQHYLGGHSSYSTSNYDRISTHYNFSNQTDTTIRQHYKSGTKKVAITSVNTYDQVGRMLTAAQQITGSNGTKQTAVTLSSATYNEVGQLYIKAVGNALQTIDYAYNERGWLTALTPQVNSSFGGTYAENIYYNSPAGSATPQFNGNISQFTYNSPRLDAANSLATTTTNTVSYTYDNLNRLTQSQSGISAIPARSDETVSYDPEGNISKMIRTGAYVGTRTYNYPSQSNQLASAQLGTNLVRNFQYDGNGNTTADSTETISYNLLNLPNQVKLNGTVASTFYYDATGQKLRNIGMATGTVDYINGIVYIGGKISYIQNAEGRNYLAADSVTYNYEYDLKDYLGNVRATYFSNSGSLNYVQENDYYPFGLPSFEWLTGTESRYLYNGKEKQPDVFNMLDYGARFYDPIVARWTSVDPLAEFTRRHSPYEYALNNPIRFNDPTGKAAGDTLQEVVIVGHVPKQSTAAQIGNFLWGAVDYIPFAGSIKQIGVGIYHGSWTEAGLGVLSLGADFATGGEGGEALRVAETATEDLVKISAEDELKEGAEKTLEEAGVEVHGNSKESTNAQHAYDVVDTETGEVVKTGVSGGKETAAGESVRGEKQARAWNKASGKSGKYKSVITHRVPAGAGARKEILSYEVSRATELRTSGQLTGGFHVRP